VAAPQTLSLSSSTLERSEQEYRHSLSHTIEYPTEGTVTITITVPPDIVTRLFEETAVTQQKLLRPTGFDYRETPLSFIKQQHYHSLFTHLKEFLIKFYVLNYLFKTIRTEKLVIAGDPSLDSIVITQEHVGLFTFSGAFITPPPIQEWRYLPFKAPKRKNYKDLDRQVEHFIVEEITATQHHAHKGIQENDWVCISLTPTDATGSHLFDNLIQFFWIQISDEKVDNPLRDLLLDMHVGNTVITQNAGIQEYFSEQLATNYHFSLTIVTTVPYSYVCFEQIKTHFKLKTKKDLLKKLIEVFSYRNDISQRRAMVEECLELLLAKHPLSVPVHIINAFKETLLGAMHTSPDYNVYRTQKEFYTLIYDLSEKIAKETVFLDALAYHEKVAIDRSDIENYLNCIKRSRTKEFIYSRSSIPHYEGQSTLIPEEDLIRIVLREKVINHVLYHLTKE
jgi:FKBP-type peptidyl-prolyl cis-trans isomerase (trigger factor)